MTNYWEPGFLRHLDITGVKTVFEVGARYGDESIKLSQVFPNAIIYSFECNPLTVNIARQKLEGKERIHFNPFGLGDKNETHPFYSYIQGNDGASSLYKRIDFNESQKETGVIEVKTLKDFVKERNIESVDLLCMDVQGYELNILKGAGDFITNIKYIIMEEPKDIIDTKYLPEGIHSKYIGAPTPKEIKKFVNNNGFIEIERIEENKIEDNVMYKRI